MNLVLVATLKLLPFHVAAVERILHDVDACIRVFPGLLDLLDHPLDFRLQFFELVVVELKQNYKSYIGED